MAEAPFQRQTKQRKIILEELKGLKTHPTASELYELVRKRQPRISLGTVYRNLELMHQFGMVRKLPYGHEARFDADVSEHYHLRCIRCDRVEDMHDVPLHAPKLKVDDPHGYELVGFELEWRGICPGCRQQLPE